MADPNEALWLNEKEPAEIQEFEDLTSKEEESEDLLSGELHQSMCENSCLTQEFFNINIAGY